MSNNDRWGGPPTPLVTVRWQDYEPKFIPNPKIPLQQGLHQTYLPVGRDQSGGNKWDREVSKNYVLSGIFPKVYP